MAIAPLNIASATGVNWLKEAQESAAAAEDPGGLMGMLQDSKYPASIENFLTKSQKTAANFALITQGTQQAAATLALQMADAAQAKRMEEKFAQAQKFNQQQTNYNPPTELEPVIYFGDGSNIDTTTSIMTLLNGTQIDITTGQEVVDLSSIINLANGAYIDTKKNIMTLSNGTKIDTITGLQITV
jgi:hypothetical protein